MRLEWLSEEALIVRDLPFAPYAVARALNERGMPGLFEAVASYDTLALFVDPSVFPLERVQRLILTGEFQVAEPRRHEIPVLYEGEDLEQVTAALGMDVEEFVKHHAGRDYTCFAVGFSPGFPYLGYLPDEIAGLPRLPSPRLRVPPGSVALTGRQTGIYPLERPGGWRLIGRTPLTMVDLRDGYFPIEAGDLVRFTPISRAEFGRLEGCRL